MKKTSWSWVLSIVLTALLMAGIGFTQYRPRSSAGASVSSSALANGTDAGTGRGSRNPNTKRPEDAEIRRQFLDAVDTYDSAVVRLDSALVRLSIGGSPDQARAEFRQARYAYKAIEPLVERYAPVAAQTINGPAIDKPNEDSPTLAIPPNGFQVIEVSLYPKVQREEIPAMRQEVAVLRVGAKRIRELIQYTSFTDQQLFDAVRVHMGRVMTLGLAGFDATLSQDALAEAAASIRGVRGMLLRFEAAARQRDASAWTELDQALTRVLYMLDTAGNFNDFDRLTFIVSGATPLVTALDRVRASLGIPAMTDRRTWKPSALTVFQPGAFDLGTYAPPYAQSTSWDIVDLGCALFADPLLSEQNERSCASCHHPTRAFTDGLPKAVQSQSHTKLPVPTSHASVRNTPTLLGTAYQSSQFADQRVAYLEDQVTEVLANPAEMGGGAAAAADRIQRVARYQAAFSRAFGAHPANTEPQREVTELRLRMALAAYMRTLSPLNSRFDRAVRGDMTALTREERQGFNVFMGKGKCGTCHFAPLFNGTVPPDFTETEVEIIGTPDRAVTQSATLDADIGASKINRAPLHNHAFKTPTVRNVALTGPYMHNGAYPTLESVVEFYNLGGGVGIGATVPNQTLPPDRLNLSAAEKRALIAFMRALTDTAGTTRHCAPLR